MASLCGFFSLRELGASSSASRLAAPHRPNRVSYRTDWPFTSCCSPPRLATTQLQSVPSYVDLERTFTSPVSGAFRRTSPGQRPGSENTPSLPGSPERARCQPRATRFRGSAEAPVTYRAPSGLEDDPCRTDSLTQAVGLGCVISPLWGSRHAPPVSSRRYGQRPADSGGAAHTAGGGYPPHSGAETR